MTTDREKPTVSVVIPAYNAEKTIERLLNCVLNQTWQALQVILVDDGSEDRTAEIAEKTAQKDLRLTVIRQENLGVSTTRNTGLARCTGKYIRLWTRMIPCRQTQRKKWSGGLKKTGPNW